MIEITLPWPDKRLSPNARVHWREKATVTKHARKMAYVLAWEGLYYLAYLGRDDVKFEAQITYHPPDRRRRDILDNLPASIKPFIDGMCDCMGIDDYQIQRTVNEWGDVTPGGKVVLTLEEME